MLGLTFRLALTNLRKNRRLYYPYILMTMVSTTIAYIFASLAFHPNLGEVWGANQVTHVLGLGMIVVMITVTSMIFYANSFIMKQRSKEFGVYSILGLEKKHLFLMTCFEHLVFSIGTVGSGLILGIVLDRFFYALLLKVMQMKVVLASTFQMKNVIMVATYLLAVFLLVSIFNISKLGLTDSLKLVQGKKIGDKKAVFLPLQTLTSLILLAIAYTIAQSGGNPSLALPSFFGATLLVILATYLLFQAGVITFLNWLKNRQSYYYKPANFISISNLIFRMRKNAMGLATITILSAMFLVTMIGGLNIYIGGKDHITNQNPNDFSIDIGLRLNTSREQVQKWADDILKKAQIPVKSQVTYDYQRFYFANATTQRINFLSDEEYSNRKFSKPVGIGYIIDQNTYQKMTGQTLDLSANQLAIYGDYQKGQEVEIGSKRLQVAQVLHKNITLGHLPKHAISLTLGQHLVLVVNNLDMFTERVDARYYLGYESSLPEEEQVKAREHFLTRNFESELWDRSLLPNGLSVISLGYRAYAMRSFFSLAGSLFFIGLLLSLIFLMAVVLVIYFKQISEGFEDRSRFVIMTKVGLDEQQTRQSIRKQLLTVFFLPVLLAFVHLGFAYKMLSSILFSIGVVNTELIFKVAVGLCSGYFLLYSLVYMITTRSYKRIIS
ncbi:FtsX-like permease family protein [Streptococcus ruminantium]|uniref:FtsX-like permease family protein n=1 Tax=Streptococcus ruminantium TaxID=1917441 RepID=UPI00280DF23F|nr:FtsX-like permease family protein [Streptococcus ruminantium]MDQ8837631.1 FtsX-like permease family protein [Streptococcus ruminantium]